MEIKVELSNRHVHLTQEAADILFGPEYQLTVHKNMVPPAFAAKETVTIVGKKGMLEGVRVLAPYRKVLQVELMRSDCIRLGIDAPVCMSGDVNSMGPCKIIGPKGELEVEHGVMIAQRHIHVTEETAQKFGLKNKQIVKIRGGRRMTTFEDCFVKVYKGVLDVIHLDFDEGNAAALSNGDMMEVIP